ncbi:MAG: glycine oxidase ThiO [Deltaproteobacteria bacterium]
MSAPDVIVVGAGIVGSAVALERSVRGAKVTLLERSVPGAEASTVAAGILAPHVEHPEDAVLASLGEQSRELHARWSERFRDCEGIDVGFRRTGALVVAHATDPVDARVAHHRGAGVVHERLTGSQARALEPALSPRIEAAVLLPEEAQVEPPKLLRALALAAELSGARVVRGLVRGVRIEGGRVRGVELESGLTECSTVIVAAGSWTSLVPGAGGSSEGNAAAGHRELLREISPVRGQLVHAEAHPRLVRRLVFGSGGYVVPRGDGRYVCGATTEDVGFEKETTLGGIHQVLERAIVVVPELSGARFVSHHVNLRPGTPDGRPLVGRGAADGLWIASGHYRTGVLLAPVTAKLLADLVTNEPSASADARLAALSPTRFR